MQNFWNGGSKSSQEPINVPYNFSDGDSALGANSPSPTQRRKEIVFIDSRVEDYQSLVAGVAAGTEVIILDPTRDGIEQITQVLASRTDVEAVHIVSHGAPGQIFIGRWSIALDDLTKSNVRQWRQSLSADAEILLYGCNVAAGVQGRQFVERLAQLTGAEVYASNAIVGSSERGGTWRLRKVGNDEELHPVDVFTPATIASYTGVFVTINPTGGTNSTNGIRIQVEPDGDFYILRNGGQQVFSLNSSDTVLAIGTTTYGSDSIYNRNWVSLGQSAVTGAGTSSNPFQVVTSLLADVNSNGIYDPTIDFRLDWTVSYAAPDNFYAQRFTILAPAGNTQTVKLTQVFDSFLGGSDSGPAYGLDASGTVISGTSGNPKFIGVSQNLGQPNEIVMGYIEDNAEFSRWYSGAYFSPYSEINNGGNLTPTYDTDAFTDNGIAVQYDLGALTGTRTISNFLGFSADAINNLINHAPSLTGTPAALMAGTEDTSYTINAANLLQGFTDVDGDTLSVSNLTASNGTLVNNNNGTWSFTPAANYNGSVNLSYNVTDGKGGSTAATQSFILAAVNDAPSFIAGANQTITAGAGVQTVAGWATGFSPGPANEAGQTVLAYEIVSNTNAGLFTTAPTIDPVTGNLTYTPTTSVTTPTTATLGVRVRDNGGTANGGIDTSAVQTFTITVNPQPTISISDVTLTEGNSGTTNAVFTVSLSNPSSQTVTVNYATANGTATAGSDYTGIPLTPITFAPGQTTQTISVAVNGDTLYETNETFNVNLSGATNATIADGTGIGTISNDDAPPTISINDVTLTEGNNGTTLANFTVSLSNASALPVTVNYGTANGTATAGSDYTATTGTLTFNPGVITQTISVPVIGDAVVEGNETFFINLSNPTNAAIADNQGQGTITNDDTAGITITPTTGLTTTEAGGTATFTVRLNSQPTADVTLGLSSSNPNEGTVSTPTLTFTAANWNVAQTVTVTGVNDFVADGDIAYNIITAPAVSTDANYAGLDAADVAVTNTDNDIPGFTLTPIGGSTTTEAGGTASFRVVLNTQPTADVTLALSSSNTDEGTVSTPAFTFTAANWNVAQTITVRGVDDSVADGNIAYNLTAAATSTDLTYNTLNPVNVALTNLDNDTAGFTITPTTGLTTTEAGGTATFTVRLSTRPTADVTLGLSSSDTTEGTISTGNLTFTQANWNVAQTVTVRGVDDFVKDGNIAYNIVTAAATSADANYNGLNPTDIALTNTDNDVAGFTITPTTGLTTTEAGGTATFTVRLNSQPTANVTLGLSSSDTTEGRVSTPSLTFTAANWNVAQTVTVTGVDDALVDGNIAYSIITAPAVSADSNYNNLNPVDIAITNSDNEVAYNGINGTSLSETLVGTTLNDRIDGYDGHDIITGGLGKDLIYGGPGNDELIGDFKSLVGESAGYDDIIYGGTGQDRIYGGGGNDSLYGDEGNDQIWGDAGNDLIWGNQGNDILTGGAGRDTFVFARGEGTDTIRDFQVGQDFIGLTGPITFGQLSITQMGSQTLIRDTFNQQALAILDGVNASTLISQSSTTFVRV